MHGVACTAPRSVPANKTERAYCPGASALTWPVESSCSGRAVSSQCVALAENHGRAILKWFTKGYSAAKRTGRGDVWGATARSAPVRGHMRVAAGAAPHGRRRQRPPLPVPCRQQRVPTSRPVGHSSQIRGYRRAPGCVAHRREANKDERGPGRDGSPPYHAYMSCKHLRACRAGVGFPSCAAFAAAAAERPMGRRQGCGALAALPTQSGHLQTSLAAFHGPWSSAAAGTVG